MLIWVPPIRLPGCGRHSIIAGGPNLTLNADLTIGTLIWESTAPNMQLNTSVSTLTINGGTIEGGLLLGGFINNGTLNVDVPAGVNSSAMVLLVCGAPSQTTHVPTAKWAFHHKLADCGDRNDHQ